jgi:hypothetical protein
VQELLQQYEKELPQLQRADQVKKAILKVKSQGSWFKLEAVLERSHPSILSLALSLSLS